MSTEVAVPGEIVDAELVEDELWPIGPDRRQFGHVIIEWPAPRGKDGDPRMMPAWDISVLDAATGRPIITVEKLTLPAVTADASSFVTADLVMFADAEGNPLMPSGEPGGMEFCLDDEGKARTGVFTFIVAEMRVRGN